MREFILQHADMLEYLVIAIIVTGHALFVALLVENCREANR